MADLVLDSLEIQNFRAFRHLKIERLGRVNLITGKNNVGKTCLLEALWLYATHGDPHTITDQLILRGEMAGHNAPLADSDVILRYAALVNIFFERSDVMTEQKAIAIGPLSAPDAGLAIRIAPYIWRQNQNQSGLQLSPIGPADKNMGSVVPTIEVLVEGNTLTFPLDQGYTNQFNLNFLRLRQMKGAFVPAAGLNPNELNQLWDAVTLTEEENNVLRSLQIIAPSVSAINLRSEKSNSGARVPFVRDSNAPNPLPLRSMGEGMNRLFGLALALVNSKGGMLLIDEVETGLHYSVLRDVWKLIFETAHRLNIQVFATKLWMLNLIRVILSGWGLLPMPITICQAAGKHCETFS